MTLDKDSGWFPADFGEVYKTTVSWVELILPANTRAFNVGANNTPGFGFCFLGLVALRRRRIS